MGNIRDARDALQQLHAGIEGVKSAPTEYPASIDTADLPIVLCYPMAGTTQRVGVDGPRRADRVYSIQVLIAPVGQNTHPDNMNAAIDLLERLLAAYFDPELILSSGNTQIVLDTREGKITDSGLDIMPSYDSAPYYGFEINVSMYTKD